MVDMVDLNSTYWRFESSHLHQFVSRAFALLATSRDRLVDVLALWTDPDAHDLKVTYRGGGTVYAAV